MSDETERIDRMVAEGKISSEEGQRMKAAIGKTERKACPNGGETGTAHKRTCRMAVAGAFGLPAAIVSAALTYAFLDLFVLSGEKIRILALVIFGIVLLTGWILSLCGFLAVRANPGELTGRGIATIGILLPFAMGGIVILFAMAKPNATYSKPAVRVNALDNPGP